MDFLRIIIDNLAREKAAKEEQITQVSWGRFDPAKDFASTTCKMNYFFGRVHKKLNREWGWFISPRADKTGITHVNDGNAHLFPSKDGYTSLVECKADCAKLLLEMDGWI